MSELRFEGSEPEWLEVAEPDCVAEDFGGEVVVLNSATGVYYSLTDLAAGVWRDILAGHSVDSLVSAIGNIDRRLSGAASGLIQSLMTAGLLRRADPQSPSSPALESVTLIGKGETKLTMQSFDDMKDLILADPIHDVEDNVGWPVLRRVEDE